MPCAACVTSRMRSRPSSFSDGPCTLPINSVLRVGEAEADAVQAHAVGADQADLPQAFVEAHVVERQHHARVVGELQQRDAVRQQAAHVGLVAHRRRTRRAGSPASCAGGRRALMRRSIRWFISG